MKNVSLMRPGAAAGRGLGRPNIWTTLAAWSAVGRDAGSKWMTGGFGFALSSWIRGFYSYDFHNLIWMMVHQYVKDPAEAKATYKRLVDSVINGWIWAGAISLVACGVVCIACADTRRPAASGMKAEGVHTGK